MPAQPARSPASCRVSSPLDRSLGPLERQRPRCGVPAVCGFGAAAVPETRAAANRGFLFISWWRLHFSGTSQRPTSRVQENRPGEPWDGPGCCL